MKNVDLELLYRNFQRNVVKKVDEDDPLRSLSKRELQVLIAIGHGLRPQEAADRVNIKIKTFSTYRARLLDKLRLQSNAELAILAFELKLVPGVLANMKAEVNNEHVEGNGG